MEWNSKLLTCAGKAKIVTSTNSEQPIKAYQPELIEQPESPVNIYQPEVIEQPETPVNIYQPEVIEQPETPLIEQSNQQIQPEITTNEKPNQSYQQDTYNDKYSLNKQPVLLPEYVVSTPCVMPQIKAIKGEYNNDIEYYCRCVDGSYGFDCNRRAKNPCLESDLYFSASFQISDEYFIHCSHGTPNLFKCPSSLQWDPELLTCASPVIAEYEQIANKHKPLDSFKIWLANKQNQKANANETYQQMDGSPNGISDPIIETVPAINEPKFETPQVIETKANQENFIKKEIDSFLNKIKSNKNILDAINGPLATVPSRLQQQITLNNILSVESSQSLNCNLVTKTFPLIYELNLAKLRNNAELPSIINEILVNLKSVENQNAQILLTFQ